MIKEIKIFLVIVFLILSGVYIRSSDAATTQTIAITFTVMDLGSSVVPIGEGRELSATDDYKTKIIIPANSYDKSVKYSLESENRNSIVFSNDSNKALVAYNIKAEESETGKNINTVNKQIAIVLHTTSIDGQYVDNTEQKVKLTDAKSRLALGFWNGLRWMQIQSSVEVSGNDIYVTGTTSHFSYYGIIVKSVGEKLSFSATPNPFTPKSSNPLFNKITFVFENPDNENIELKIWDLTAGLIRTITGTGTSLIWDGTDENGEIVEGGVYIYQLKVGSSRAGRGTIVVAK